MRRRVVVAGATGLVGRAIVSELVRREDVTAVALVRKRSEVLPEAARQLVFDFEADGDYAALGRDGFDVLFCALGTTRAKAGDGFRRVDHDYPVRLFGVAAEVARSQGSDVRVGLVSSVGADLGRGLYLRTKKEVEQALDATGLPYTVVRPSVLEGERDESRPGERAAVFFGTAITAASRLVRAAAKWAPIHAEVVARALVRATLDERPGASRPGKQVLEGAELFDRGA